MKSPWLETLVIRRSAPDDASFLREMLFEVAYFRQSDERPSLETAFADATLSRKLEKWGRKGDIGLVAADARHQRIGAAWLRLWTEADACDGYVDADTPVLYAAVRPDSRRRGVGTALLVALLSRARREGVERVSLNMPRDNEARRLCERLGFQVHREAGSSLVMLAELTHLPESA